MASANITVSAFTGLSRDQPLEYLSLVMTKPVFGVSDQVRHKVDCTATEDSYRIEISDLESRGIVLYV